MTVPDISLRDVSAAPDDLLFLVDQQRLWGIVDSQGASCIPRIKQVPSARNAAFYIGRTGTQNCFAADSTLVDLDALSNGEWLSLYQAYHRFDAATASLCGRAAQLQSWLTEHRFCSRCGTACARHDVEFAMVCPSCHFYQYPRINPCIIVLITRGEKALLAQGTRFPEGFYSCLAGFVEAGETPEEAVHREVKEEVGIEIDGLYYQGSQSWPFPHSLMLGYRAEWKAGEITPEPSEIVAADWFDKHALPNTPSKGSIASQLIESWLSGN